MYPVYNETFERYHGITPEMRRPNQSYKHTEYLIKWVKDFRRSIDYLESRTDINTGKLAYFGTSWSGYFGTIIPAIEDRLKTSVLRVGGLYRNLSARPEADAINYITRVKIPVLMLNGKYDFDYQLEVSVIPMYELLGTPKADKVLKLYNTDHFIPKNELIKEILNWLDKYLGPVETKTFTKEY